MIDYLMYVTFYTINYIVSRMKGLSPTQFLESVRFLGLTACAVPVRWWHASASMQRIWTSHRMCRAVVILGCLKSCENPCRFNKMIN